MFSQDTYRVVVEIADVQGLVWPAPNSGSKQKLPNPFVDILVGNESQWTATREATSTCTFNRLFAFSTVGLDEAIEARVYHKSLLGQELIGTYLTSVNSIRETPNHRMIQTLCPLIIRERPSEPRGFIRLSIHVLKTGEIIEADGFTSTAQRPRILHTPELDFESYYLNINIYIGNDILKTSDPVGSPLPSPRIQVNFLDSILSTQAQQTSRGPTWSETLRFPATVPCSGNRITLELWDGRDVQRVSSHILSFESILNSQLGPTWINFYTEVIPVAKRRGKRTAGAPSALAAFAALFELEDDEEDLPILIGFNYLGRILMSASCSKHKFPGPPQTFPCRLVEHPPNQELILWADLFEMTGLGKYSDIVVQLAFGDWQLSLEPTEKLIDSLGFKEQEGRVPEERFILPANLESSYDLIIRVFGNIGALQSSRGTKQRTFLAYGRLVPTDLMKKQNRAEWIDLISADKTVDLLNVQRRPKGGLSKTVAILGSFVLRKTTDLLNQEITRPERSRFATDSYTCDLCCYQAVYLPVLRSCLPSPRVVITLGGGSATTQTLFHTIHPDWHEILSLNCTLPKDLSLARSLLIQVFSHEVILGEIKLPADYLTTEEAKTPQWYPLTSTRYPKNTARIMCAFNLYLNSNIIKKDDDETPLFEVAYEPCDLRLLVFGCRLFSNNSSGDLQKAPEVQIEFGRNPNDLNSRLWYGTCDNVSRGNNGNFDYFCPLEVKCFLPRSPMFQSFVEFRVFLPYPDGSRELGTAYLHLTPHVAWLTTRIKKQLHWEFGYFPTALDELIPPPLSGLSKPCQFISPQFRTAYSYIQTSSSSHSGDLEILLCRTNELNQENEEELYDQQMSTQYQNANVFTSPIDIFFGKHSSQLHQQLTQTQYIESLKDFTWHAVEDDEQLQEDLHRSLESELHPDDLPFLILPIIGPGRNGTIPGEPDIVGILKVRCHIFPVGEDKTTENELVDALHLKFRDSPKMKARVHVLSASGLVQPLSSGHISGEVELSEWYLILKNSAQASLPGIHEIRDTKFCGKGFAPDFYRSFELDVEFPTTSLLSVGVASMGTLWSSSYFVGRTIIDLENRWAHPNFQSILTDNDNPPIETRTLRHSVNEEATGSIRMWVELLTEDESTKRPLIPVSIPPPETVEVRVVIWQVKGVPLESLGSVSLYVVGMMAGVSGNVVSQETDTHWNSNDGNGIFNWRFIFQVSVPSETSQLRLQVWGRNLLATHESIAETVIDLSSDLLKCKSLRDSIDLDRAWVKLFHPSNPTELMGLMDLEIHLAPEILAVDNSVGLGREEPNRHPYLPDVTENRNYIVSSALGQSVFATSDKVVYGAKICSWLITLIVIITLYTVFSRFFLG